MDEMFYQVFEDWVWDKHTKVMANKLSELFWSAFSRIWTKYGEIHRISLYSVRMPENSDQNNFKYGHSSRSVIYTKKYTKKLMGYFDQYTMKVVFCLAEEFGH